MSVERLQSAVRAAKTPVAMGLSPELEKISDKIRKNFEEMFGPGTMADAESLRYFSMQALELAQGKLPAVMVHCDPYLRMGMMGMDVLWNVVSAAKSRGLYVILGLGTGTPATWWDCGTDAVTVNPYLGGDVCTVPADKAVFALIRTCNPSADNLQTLRAGDRPLFAAAAEPFIRSAVPDENISAAKIAGLLQQRTEVLTDIPGKIGFFNELPEYELELFNNKKSKCDTTVALDMLLDVLPLFQNLVNWEQQTIHDALIEEAARLGVKNATLMWPIRIAVSGQQVTPGGAVEICHILGRYESLQRISQAMSRLMTM